MSIPLSAYEGSEPFLFVCYSHGDAAIVQAELAALQTAGFRLWYDDGIVAGSEWSEALARRIRECSAFLYVVTQASVRSPHCRREVNFALDQDRRLVVVHLEPTELPDGLKLSLNNRQAILRYRHPEADYRVRIARALNEALGAVARGGKWSAADSTPVASDGASGLRGAAQLEAATLKLSLHPLRTRWPATVLVATLSFIALGAAWLAGGWPDRQSSEPVVQDGGESVEVGPLVMPVRRIAVQPFRAVGEDSHLTMLADRATAEAVARLGEIRELVLIDGPAVGPLDYGLTATVDAGGEEARITFHLIADGESAWASSFEGFADAAGNVRLPWLGRLLESISAAHLVLLRGPLAEVVPERARREHFNGLVEWSRWLMGVGGNVQAAADHWAAALRYEPLFWSAQVQMVFLYANGVGKTVPLAEFAVPAYAAVQTLLAMREHLDPSAVYWEHAVASVLVSIDRDWDYAKRVITHGEKRGAFGAADAHISRAGIHAGRGDLAASRRHLEALIAGGAYHIQTGAWAALGHLESAAGRYLEAVHAFDRAIAHTFGFSELRMVAEVARIEALALAGDRAAAEQALARFWPNEAERLPELFPAALALVGRTAEAEHVLAQMEARFQSGGGPGTAGRHSSATCTSVSSTARSEDRCFSGPIPRSRLVWVFGLSSARDAGDCGEGTNRANRSP